MRSIEGTLALWVAGYLSSDQVIEWATAEIDGIRHPSPELIDLAIDGPERCLKRPAYDFHARPETPTYLQEFVLRARATSLVSDESVLTFAEWVARRSIGEDLDLPIVLFGYQVDHFLDDCHDQGAAIDFVRSKLPALMTQCEAVASSFDQ